MSSGALYSWPRLRALTRAPRSYFTRKKAAQFLMFGSRTCCHRTPQGERLSVKVGYKDYIAHVLVHENGLAGVCVTDEEYPQPLAFQLLFEMTAFVDRKTKKWKTATKEMDQPPQFMIDMLKKYQDPKNCDKVGEIQAKVSKIKLVLKQNIKDLLEGQEHLEKLIADSEDLEEGAKNLVVTSKGLNKCCKVF